MISRLPLVGALTLSFISIVYSAPVEVDECLSTISDYTASTATASTTTTANTSSLSTWWHDNGDANLLDSVAADNIRQSHLYTIQVASSDDNATYYDSFVYAAIPRNGNGNILIPNDPASATNETDGITVEASLGMSMSWTQFLYSADATIKISRTDISNATAQDITISPSYLNYEVSDSDGDIYITVPYSAQGARFSVEYSDNMYEFRTQCSDPDDCYFVSTFSSDDYIVGREPLNSLMIFASPMPSEGDVPDETAESTLVVEPGLVTGLDTTQASTVYFPAGTYYFTSTAHANLSSTVNWVHINAGAYVKGALEFNSNSTTLKTTGHGVLSGEQYVYQANPSYNYTNYKDGDENLKMISGYSFFNTPQTFSLTGITVASPPYNSFDFTGELDSISLQASDYKQVGAYFGQTDGLTVLTNAHLHDIFYHSNDDVIKTYYSNSLVERILVWKGTTAPIIQFGWASRNISNITVQDVDVIHTRWNSNISHPSIIGANQVYGVAETQTNTADLDNTVSDITFQNINVEAINGGNLFRIVPLQTIQNLTINNVYINAYPPAETGMRDSELPGWWNSYGQMAGIENFVVRNFTVANNATNGGGGSAVLASDTSSTTSSKIDDIVAAETVTSPTLVDFGMANWEIGQLGSLNIASAYLSGTNGVQILSK